MPVLDVPANTFWDIGRSDGCAVWLHQEWNAEDRFIGYFETHNENLAFYVRRIKEIGAERGLTYNKHFLPHDFAHKRPTDTNKST